MAHQSPSSISVVNNVNVPENSKHQKRYNVTITVTIADVKAIGSLNLFPLNSCLKITFDVISMELSSECLMSSSVTSYLFGKCFVSTLIKSLHVCQNITYLKSITQAATIE